MILIVALSVRVVALPVLSVTLTVLTVALPVLSVTLTVLTVALSVLSLILSLMLSLRLLSAVGCGAACVGGIRRCVRLGRDVLNRGRFRGRLGDGIRRIGKGFSAIRAFHRRIIYFFSTVAAKHDVISPFFFSLAYLYYFVNITAVTADNDVVRHYREIADKEDICGRGSRTAVANGAGKCAGFETGRGVAASRGR